MQNKIYELLLNHFPGLNEEYYLSVASEIEDVIKERCVMKQKVKELKEDIEKDTSIYESELNAILGYKTIGLYLDIIINPNMTNKEYKDRVSDYINLVTTQSTESISNKMTVVSNSIKDEISKNEKIIDDIDKLDNIDYKDYQKREDYQKFKKILHSIVYDIDNRVLRISGNKINIPLSFKILDL